MFPISILDLSPIPAGSTPATALANSLDLAQHAEAWGYQRYWLAEHHNMPGIASAATAVVIGHVAAGTKSIRVGAGGIMLPNHSPLVVAEQFGTLASLFPDRIELGLGRAPGTDSLTAQALRHDATSGARFPQDVLELQHYFEPVEPGQKVRAVPGAGLRVPLWILGSSLFGAQLAAALGLPYAFASHFAPDALVDALDAYRAAFRPSRQLEAPHAMVGVNVFAAESDAEARRQFTSVQQSFINLRRGTAGQVPAPVESMDGLWSESERAGVEHALAFSFIGTRERIARGLQEFIDAVEPDELMVAGHFHDHAARLRSFEILADIGRTLRAAEKPAKTG